MRNGQNDIVGLMDNAGAVMVNYSYDAWGKLLSVSGTLATTLGQNNPFRYRGYYYDTETGLYYLQTRYYDPEVCRFISADVYLSTGLGVVGNNMYAYCNNDPTISEDSQGTVVGLVIGGVTLTVGQLVALAVIISVGIDWVTNRERSMLQRTSNKIVEGLEALVGAISATLAITSARTYQSPTNVHHIVAQNEPKAADARKALKSVGMTTEDASNLVAIKTSLHVRLHKKEYYSIINAGITAAAYSKGTMAERKVRVEAVLNTAKSILTIASKLLAW